MAITDDDAAEPATLPADRAGDLELARRIARVLLPAARTLGIPHEGIAFDDLARQVFKIATADPKRCPLDSATFQAVYEIREVLGRRQASLPPE
jgi:hypothetical protein